MPPAPGLLDLDLLSSLVVQKALEILVLPEFEESSGFSVHADYLPTSILLEKLDAGAEPDVVIGTRAAILDLEAAGVLAGGSATPLVRSAIGLGVAGGSAPVAIATEKELIDALLGARSVAFSRAGQSGIFFQELIERLGIADEVLARATALESGYTGAALMDGRADLALQQVSELLFVDGIGPVVPLPDECQQYTEFLVAVGCRSADRGAAHRLLRHLTNASAREAYASTGLSML